MGVSTSLFCCRWPLRTVASVFMIGDWLETCTGGLELRSSIDLGGMRDDLRLDVDVPREDKLRPGSFSLLYTYIYTYISYM